MHLDVMMPLLLLLLPPAHPPTHHSHPPSLSADMGGSLGSGGLLGSLGSLISTLESVSGATSGSDEEGGKNGAPGASGAAGGVIDVEVDVVSMLASTDLEGGDVPFCPDGSEECPIPWENMVSGEQPAEQPAAGTPATKAS